MRKRCNRKVWTKVNPIQHAIEGAALTPQHLLDQLRMRELAAVDAFAKGGAGLQEWKDLTAMLNVCETMAKDGVGPEALPTCQDAEAHLIDAARRFERTGKMGTTGPGIQAFRSLYEYHDLQRQSVSRAQYEQAIQRTKNRVRSKAPEVVAL